MSNKDMVYVPRFPTMAMVEAGRKAMEQQDPVRVSHARVIWLWQDMMNEALNMTKPSLFELLVAWTVKPYKTNRLSAGQMRARYGNGR